MMVALGTVLMTFGAFFEVMDLTVCAIASLIVALIYIELGSPYTWLVWICTSLTTFLCFSGSIIWVEYLFVFGIYPILKAYIEKLPRVFWIVLKLAFINAVIWLMVLVCEKLLGIPFFGGETFWLNAAVYVVMNVAFVAYDLFITVLVRLYFAKYRHRFSKFFK